jgi:uncharacterized membrane protein YphA (DoxX/SURF4 family)
MLGEMNSDSLDGRKDWRLGTRIAFRFAFAWLVLINLPFPLSLAPPLERFLQPWEAMWTGIVSFTGRHFFGLQTVANDQTGSGDRTYDYILLLCQTSIAILVTIVWSLIDRRRHYRTLQAWLRIYVRFALAAAMLAYGAYKVIPSQFPPNSPFRLSETFGEASPMGLLWAFMGASATYTIFAGLGEVAGGVLLAFRRTTLLGALVSMAVMINVIALNFSYDVPVKLYSSTLFLEGLFLVIPDAQRLFDFFVLQRTPAPGDDPSPIATPVFRRAAPILAIGFLLVAFGFPITASYKNLQRYAKTSPIYGTWNVEAFSVDGVLRPPLTTDAFRWRRLTFHTAAIGNVRLMDDSRQRYLVALDERRHEVTFTPREHPEQKAVFAYVLRQPGTLVLNGTLASRKVEVRLRADDLSKLLLTSRGFHWINEVPFNR